MDALGEEDENELRLIEEFDEASGEPYLNPREQALEQAHQERAALFQQEQSLTTLSSSTRQHLIDSYLHLSER